MQRRFLRRDIAAWRHFPAEVKEVVDSILLGHKDALEELAGNPTRSAVVVPAIYSKKLPGAEIARSLCSAPLRPEEVALVVPREKRVTVLYEFFVRNHVDAELLASIAGKSSPAVAREILDMFEDAPPALRKAMALRAGGLPLLQEICFGSAETFSDAEALDVLVTSGVLSDSSIRDHYRTQFLSTLFSRRMQLARPLLERLLVESPEDRKAQRVFPEVAEAFARSVHPCPETVLWLLGLQESFQPWAFRSVAEPLLKNPFVSMEAVELIRTGPFADEFMVKHTLQHLPRRLSGSLRELSALPDVSAALKFVRSNYWTSPLWGVVELLANPLLSTVEAEELRMLARQRSRGAFQRLFRKELTEVGVEVVPFRVPRPAPQQHDPSPETVAELELVVGMLGTEKASWEAFLGLLNEFDGSLSELAEIAAVV